MASTQIVISHTSVIETPVAGHYKGNLNRLINFIAGLASGALKGLTIDILANASGTPTAASGTVTIASGSGTITATINGVAISITWATSDTNSATLLKNAINASTNALVQGWVVATSSAGVVTITATQKSAWGNSITLAASGTGATVSGARLTGGAGGLGSYVSNTVG